MKYVWILFLGTLSWGQTQHTVKLRWNTSVSTDVTSQRVLRGAQRTGPFSVIKYGVKPLIRTWTDTNVVSGQTYFYQVKSVCDGCDPQVSKPSNTVKAIIP